MGDINLTFSEKGDWAPYLNGTFSDGYILGGVVSGPIWFGSWGPDDADFDKDPSKATSGQFMVRFTDDWSAFSGTKGNWHSCSNAGQFTGEKVY